ncbi:MAG: HEPN domain-containing protein [Chloroflexi bacterium]|nr:HEPN domain-containing protein [Chloroflexota bacterium]
MSPRTTGRVPGSPEEWMSHAASDLRLAHLAAGDESIRREQVCFHAQQAAEKAIKALLLSRSIEFPLTHDIEELLEIAESSGISLPADVREAGLLNPYAVESRYPGYWFEITEADLAEAMQSAERTLAWAAAEIESLRKPES